MLMINWKRLEDILTMKSRSATYVICIIAVTLLIYNQVLIGKIKDERIKNVELQDHFFDIQTEYEALFDEVLKLENQIENQK